MPPSGSRGSDPATPEPPSGLPLLPAAGPPIGRRAAVPPSPRHESKSAAGPAQYCPTVHRHLPAPRRQYSSQPLALQVRQALQKPWAGTSHRCRCSGVPAWDLSPIGAMGTAPPSPQVSHLRLAVAAPTPSRGNRRPNPRPKQSVRVRSHATAATGIRRSSRRWPSRWCASGSAGSRRPEPASRQTSTVHRRGGCASSPRTSGKHRRADKARHVVGHRRVARRVHGLIAPRRWVSRPWPAPCQGTAAVHARRSPVHQKAMASAGHD